MKETEKMFLYNPFDVRHWDETEIEEQVRKLIYKYNADADTMYEMALNVEIVANITYLFGEMKSRLGKEAALLKLECDTEEGKQIYLSRKNFALENPDEKAPAIKYFESKAKEMIHDKRKRQLEAEENEERFKYSLETYENIMNAIKKKMESVKFESV